MISRSTSADREVCVRNAVTIEVQRADSLDSQPGISKYLVEVARRDKRSRDKLCRRNVSRTMVAPCVIIASPTDCRRRATKTKQSGAGCRRKVDVTPEFADGGLRSSLQSASR